MLFNKKLIEKVLNKRSPASFTRVCSERDPDLPKISGGLWIKGRVDDKKIWEWVEDEKITAFSWGGQPIKDTVVRKPTGSYYILEKADIIDISVVTWPADLNAQIKIVDKEKKLIEGYVSTSKQNRRYEFILPTVFEYGMKQYMSMPPKGTLFFNHKSDRPVGKILEWKVTKRKIPERQKQQPLDEPGNDAGDNDKGDSVGSIIYKKIAQKGKNGKPEGDGGSNFCICPKCKTKVEHNRDGGQGKAKPCTKYKCPECGAQMIGEKEYKKQKKK